MSENYSNDKAAMLAKIASINHVDGFDPTPFAVDYTDLNTNETAKDCFVATARIYTSYKNSPEEYLAEATASRSFQEDKPTVSPREWAQTAAVGIALRNAGYGLQFSMAGEEFESVAADELGVTSQAAPAQQTIASTEEYTVEEPAVPMRELTMEEKYEQALAVPCPISKFKGKSLGEVLGLDPNAIHWCATKFTGDTEVKAAAQIICEYAAQQAS